MGNCVGIYLCKMWGLKPGDVVNITVTKMDDPYKTEYIDTKKICKTGTGVFVFFRKSWGIDKGTLVSIKVVPNEAVDDTHTRIPDQEGH